MISEAFWVESSKDRTKIKIVLDITEAILYFSIDPNQKLHRADSYPTNPNYVKSTKCQILLKCLLDLLTLIPRLHRAKVI